MPKVVLVAGASGFVGTALVSRLVDEGYVVRAMTRRPNAYDGAAEPVFGDVDRPESLDAALAGAEVAYYLVHSLAATDFEDRDSRAARAFGAAAARAGVGRIVYLGGLGEDGADLSAHLRSRREVETLLAEGGVPVTTLRAAVIIGHGGISWEMTRQLVSRLPVMITPRWVQTRTQPIALEDIVGYLVAILDVPQSAGRAYDVGGPEVLRYVDMMKRTARIQNHRRLIVVPVPLLTPRLSSMWLRLVTDVDIPTARNLVDSLGTEVVVTDDAITSLLPGPTLSFDDAVRRSLTERMRVAAANETHAQAEPTAVVRRRRIVVLLTLAVGAALLGLSLTQRPGAGLFYVAAAALAATWTVGGLLSGPLHLGRSPSADKGRRPLLGPLLLGLAIGGAFLLGALVVREVHPLRHLVQQVLDHARHGSLPLVVALTVANGIAEEIFFRGAVFAAVGRRHPVRVTTIVYALVTVASGNAMLVFAALTVGTLFAVERLRTGGVLASSITHVTWSLVMLLALPAII
ncbi:MAG TPA: NAD(P)H-binding protein [Jatrophihabitantaceae bacterium]|jgi:uncharacterized protein YbjT (DUF2867 family)/membrane protease YdiL (CAAX protease family)|nr:NAD(P)H-binding protein [Jatrophihabitantaceae bacterium]